MIGGFDSKAVVIGEYSGQGIVEETDSVGTDRGGEPVLVRTTVLKLRRSDFLTTAGACSVSRGDTVIVEDVGYQVSDIRVEELDGRELHLVIRKV
jgi:hypothetical protein